MVIEMTLYKPTSTGLFASYCKKLASMTVTKSIIDTCEQEHVVFKTLLLKKISEQLDNAPYTRPSLAELVAKKMAEEAELAPSESRSISDECEEDEEEVEYEYDEDGEVKESKWAKVDVHKDPKSMAGVADKLMTVEKIREKSQFLAIIR